jgi:vancomycin permeability regulator SanA
MQSYLRERYNNFREIFARIKAFLEVEIFHSQPRYL